MACALSTLRDGWGVKIISELQAQRHEVLDDWQVLGDDAGEGAWCSVLGAWVLGDGCEGPGAKEPKPKSSRERRAAKKGK